MGLNLHPSLFIEEDKESLHAREEGVPLLTDCRTFRPAAIQVVRAGSRLGGTGLQGLELAPLYSGKEACTRSTKVCHPFTLHPTPYTLHPEPYTLNPSPYTLRPTPSTLN